MERYRLFPSGELGMHPTGNWTPYADAQATVEALQRERSAIEKVLDIVDPAKVLSVRLEDLLRVLDKAADHFLIPCQGMLALGEEGCPDCRDALELKSELLKMASILRAEGQEKMKTGMPFGAKSKKIRK